MRGKGKKKFNEKNGKKIKNGENGKKNNNGGKSKGGKKSRKSGGRTKFSMDIFNEEVMENAYYTCHNIMDVLKCRGFPWPGARKKKKKGRK